MFASLVKVHVYCGAFEIRQQTQYADNIFRTKILAGLGLKNLLTNRLAVFNISAFARN